MLRHTTRQYHKVLYTPPRAKGRNVNSQLVINTTRGSYAEMQFKYDYKGNILSNRMIEALERSFTSMNRDTNVRAVSIYANPTDWSLGTDYLYFAKCQEQSDAEKYLTNLQTFMYTFSKYETPMIPYIEGRALGSGAVLAAISTFTLCDPYAKFSFPEVQLGSTPTGGASFVLSRLPHNIGYYLALTGAPIYGSDIINLNLGHRLYDKDEHHQLHLSMAASSYNIEDEHFAYYGPEFKDKRQQLEEQIKQEEQQDVNEIINRTNLGPYWKKHRENIRMVVADVLYRRKVSEAFRKQDQQPYAGFTGQTIRNRLKDFEGTVMDVLNYLEPDTLSLMPYLDIFDRCFGAPTYQEMLQAFEQEAKLHKAPFINNMLNKIKQGSPIASRLTFEMLKQARSQDWKECLKLEHSVALKLWRHPDFKNGVISRLSRQGHAYEWQDTQPSEDQIQEILNEKKGLELPGVNYELTPVKYYFRDFPQSIRNVLNQEQSFLHHVNQNSDFEARAFMNMHGIDLRDAHIDMDRLRQAVYLSYEMNRLFGEKLHSLLQVAHSRVAKRMIFDNKRKAIEQIFENEEKFYELLNNKLEQHFQQAFRERLKFMMDKCRDVHKLEKYKFYRELRDFLTRTRYTSVVTPDSVIQRSEKVSQLDKLPLFFPQNDKKSYRDELDEITSKESSSFVNVSDFFPITHMQSYLEKNFDKIPVEEVELQLHDELVRLKNIIETLEADPEKLREQLDAEILPEDRDVPDARTNYRLPVIQDMIEEELYIKLGERSKFKALEKIQSKDFKINFAEMEQRRREVIYARSVENSSIPIPNKNKRILYAIFSQYFIAPNKDQIDESVYKALEYNSLGDLIDDLYKLRTQRQWDNSIRDDLFYQYRLNFTKIENLKKWHEAEEHPKRKFQDMGNRVLLDKDYYKIIYGESTYLPKLMQFKPEDLEKLDDKFEDFSAYQDSAKWAMKQFESVISQIFEERKKVEPLMTQTELENFDRQFSFQFLASNVKRRMLEKLYEAQSFLTDLVMNDDERLEQGNIEGQAKSGTSIPGLKKDLEQELIIHSMEMYENIRYEEEFGKEKSLLAIDPQSIPRFEKFLEVEKRMRGTLKPYDSPNTYFSKWQGSEIKTSSQQYNDYIASAHKKDVQIQEFQKFANLYYSVEKLLQNQKFKQQMEEKGALENYEAFKESIRNVMET